jgi:predicted PurR-regulated permease PerM
MAEGGARDASVETGPVNDPATDPIAAEAADVEAADAERPAQAASFKSARMPSTPFWIALALLILTVAVLVTAAGVLFVFAVGVALAFFLVPVVNWLERRAWPRWLAAIAVVVVTVLGAIIILVTVIGVILQQGIAFVHNIPAYLDNLSTWYDSLDLPSNVRSSIDLVLASIQENLEAIEPASVIVGLVGGLISLVGGLFAWLLLPFFLFYLLKDQPRMAGSFYARVPLPWKDDVTRILTIAVGDFAQYFKAEFLVGSIMFVFITIGMLVIGIVADAPLLVQFSILLGVAAFVFELIPQIGPILAYIPALILAIGSNPAAIVLVSVFYFIAFNIEGSILVPTFEGRMISFTGASVLVLIAMGFAIAGIIGAILALPVASIIRDLFRLFFDKAVAQDLMLEPVPAPEAEAPTS